MQNLFFLFLLGIPLLSTADDRDLYFSPINDTSADSNKPNILFVIDTSGSMNDAAPGSHTAEYVPQYNYMPDKITGKFTRNDYWYVKKDSANNISSYLRVNKINCVAINKTLLQEYIYTGPANIDIYNNVNCASTGTSDNFRIALGNYFNWLQIDGTKSGERTRIDVVKEAFTKLISTLNGVNIGIMRFDAAQPGIMGEHGGAVIMQMQAIENARDNAINIVNNLTAKSHTPITETLDEARRYFYGAEPLYGKGNYNNTITSKSITESLNATGNYRSPINATCQMNHLVLFTDGAASADSDSNGTIKNLFNTLLQQDPSLPAFNSAKPCSSQSGHGTCLDELTYYLRYADAAPDIKGQQYITSHMIGGFLGNTETGFLQQAANAGGGEYFAANNPLELSDALNNIIDNIISLDSTFTAPAVTASSSNRFIHNQSMYFSLFRPLNKTRWPGNLKKYQLSENGVLYGNNNAPAIDNQTGLFANQTRDFWNNSNQADGPKTELGGAANIILQQAQRNVFFNSSDSNITKLSLTSEIPSELSTATPDKAELLLQWVLGMDSNDSNGDNNKTDNRYPIADPLHSEARIVSYSDATDLIFFGSNEGYLHAIDSSTGKEVYSFLPRELMPNQLAYFNDTSGYKNKPYGLDGQISLIKNDTSKSLYVGMRRGGRNYYALDITDRSAPTMKFVIHGGEGDFAMLGQSWAKAMPAQINYKGQLTQVLVISGGYDPLNEKSTHWAADDMGNAIYIVDAQTGTRLWWASATGANSNHPAMRNSMPASASLVDINGDGLLDYFYTTDTGGHIFRIDINNKNTGKNDLAAVTLFASLGGDTQYGGMSGVENNRKFYTSPSASFWPDSSNGDFINLALGSGLREEPHSTAIQDVFYVLRDKKPYPATEAAKTPPPLKHQDFANGDTDFINIGRNINQLDQPYYADPTKTKEKLTLINQLKKANAWYLPMSLGHGEKIVSDATTFDSSVFFSSFSVNDANNQNTCGISLGKSQFYALDLLFGSATLDLDGDGVITEKDLKKDLNNAGYAPRPVVIFRENNRKTIMPGTETIDDTRYDDKQNDAGQGPGSGDRSKNVVRKLYWREKM